eukprot:3284135-Lingulodinium_polyedra.AAC.1
MRPTVAVLGPDSPHPARRASHRLKAAVRSPVPPRPPPFSRPVVPAEARVVHQRCRHDHRHRH